MNCKVCGTAIPARIARIFYDMCGTCYGKMAARSDDHQTDGQLKGWCRG